MGYLGISVAVMILLAISQAAVEGGFNLALLQKKGVEGNVREFYSV